MVRHRLGRVGVEGADHRRAAEGVRVPGDQRRRRLVDVDHVVAPGAQLAAHPDQPVGERGQVRDGAVGAEADGPAERDQVVGRGRGPRARSGAGDALRRVGRIPGREHANVVAARQELLRERLDVPVHAPLVGPGIGRNQGDAHRRKGTGCLEAAVSVRLRLGQRTVGVRPRRGEGQAGEQRDRADRQEQRPGVVGDDPERHRPGGAREPCARERHVGEPGEQAAAEDDRAARPPAARTRRAAAPVARLKLLADSRSRRSNTSASWSAPPASNTERLRWASPPRTRSIEASAASPTSGAATSARTSRRRRRAPGDREHRQRGAGREDDRGADVGAEAAGGEDHRRDDRRRRGRPRSPRRRSAGGPRAGRSAVSPAPTPTRVRIASAASSSFPIPKKRTPRPGFGPSSELRRQRRAGDHVDRVGADGHPAGDRERAPSRVAAGG